MAKVANPFLMKFSAFCDASLKPLIYKDAKTLGEHLANWRSQSNLLVKEAAKIFKCRSATFSTWEKDVSIPLPKYYPEIIDALGYLPEEDLSTFHGYLRSRRLRLGLSMPEINYAEGNYAELRRGTDP